MKQVIPFIITLLLLSCSNSNQTKDTPDSETIGISQDTVLVKNQNAIDTLYEINSFTYYWITGKDTLDLKIRVEEYVRDNSISLQVYNRQPILFNTAIDKINECLPLIQEDFDLQNLESLSFAPPILYKDLTTELSQDYKNQFGQKNISREQLNEFLMNSWLEQRISEFLIQFNKTTRRYGMEKFSLLSKEYYTVYIPDYDLNEYPDFAINGMELTVFIQDYEQIQNLITQVLKWANSKNSIDLLPVLTDSKDSVNVGFDLVRHRKNLEVLNQTNLFTVGFIENYNQIILTLDKGLRNGHYDKWLVGDLPPFIFANDHCPWWNGQERFSIEQGRVELIRSDKNNREYYFKCGNKQKGCEGLENYKLKFKATKEADKLKISYLEGFDFKESTRRDGL